MFKPQSKGEAAESSLTTQQGMPIVDDQSSLRIGEKGALLLEDPIFREKLFHFDQERIPERVVHARGFGAHGFFETYSSLEDITIADLFQREGEKTEVFVRFSTVVGSKGSFDLARDVRGFAVKFYTKQGNWDLVGNNIPVFFIQDPIKFPDLIHAAKPEPDRAFPQAQTAHDTFWDFISLTPESMHMIMWIMSDRAIPRSFRFMEGFGVHTFRLINSNGDSKFVKFHWKPKLGLQSVLWDEALKINGADPDFHRRDLWEAIQVGDYPEWELGLQIFDESFAERFEFDILDPTKIIPESEVPIQLVGRLVLNRCVDNFFAETEQVAFCTQNIVPGIDFTDDPLLQGRNFSYLDTQLKRLGGPNFTQLPINMPRCPMHFFQQDGHMAIRNPVGRVNYRPNSFETAEASSTLASSPGFQTYPASCEGVKIRKQPESFSDHYSQARQFYISQTLIEQQHITDALIFELSKVETLRIRERMVAHLLNIDSALGETVAEKLRFERLPAPMVPAKMVNTQLHKAPELSIFLKSPKKFTGRKIGVLITDDADANLFLSLTEQSQQAGIMLEFIAPQIGGVQLHDQTKVQAHKNIEAGISPLYDAVLLLLGVKCIDELLQKPAALNFVRDAYAHLKFIGYTESALALFQKAGISIEDMDEGFLSLQRVRDVHHFMGMCSQLRYWDRSMKFN